MNTSIVIERTISFGRRGRPGNRESDADGRLSHAPLPPARGPPARLTKNRLRAIPERLCLVAKRPQAIWQGLWVATGRGLRSRIAVEVRRWQLIRLGVLEDGGGRMVHAESFRAVVEALPDWDPCILQLVARHVVGLDPKAEFEIHQVGNRNY